MEELYNAVRCYYSEEIEGKKELDWKALVNKSIGVKLTKLNKHFKSIIKGDKKPFKLSEKDIGSHFRGYEIYSKNPSFFITLLVRMYGSEAIDNLELN